MFFPFDTSHAPTSGNFIRSAAIEGHWQTRPFCAGAGIRLISRQISREEMVRDEHNPASGSKSLIDSLIGRHVIQSAAIDGFTDGIIDWPHSLARDLLSLIGG
jgi:hypothetical protein